MTYPVGQSAMVIDSSPVPAGGPDGPRFRGRLEHEILEQAARTPGLPACTDSRGSITYAQLVRKSAHLARQLQRDHHIVAGDRIAVLCQRGSEGLIAAIGVLLAGGVYVPVSPDYPVARIEYILRNSGSRLVLVDFSSITTMDGANSVAPIGEMLSGHGNSGSVDSVIGEVAGNRSDGPAYILYTSGSTGQPKGVVVGHAALLNTFSWMADCFALRQGESFAQKTSWGFTDSLWELFLPLMVGGEVVFVADATVREPIALYRTLRESRCVITQFVPPVLSLFLSRVSSEIESPQLPNLRWVLNGGEELPRALVDRWFELFPEVGLANTYGMTESAIYATCYLMQAAPVWGMRRIPVGRPIHGAYVCVMGGNGERLLADQVGEICVGGRSLMDGYHNEPELTKDAFIKHPVSGEKLYRTGDLGAWRLDGELAYLSRSDSQVKIRGMRVELGEVEHAMLQHRSVKHAAVIVCGEGERRHLRAFYTVHSIDPGEDSVMLHLRRSLPDFMMPSRCLAIAQMPLSVHGKIDRSALTRIVQPRPAQRDSESRAPDGIEQTIMSTWRNVLGHDDFGLDDGFFAVGGNSLLLVRVYASLPTEYQGSVELADLLRFPSIRSLAERLRTLLGNRAAIPSSQIVPSGGSRRALESRRLMRHRANNDGGERPGARHD